MPHSTGILRGVKQKAVGRLFPIIPQKGEEMKDSKSDIIEYSIFILIFTVVFVLATLIFNKLYPVEEELEDLKAEPIREETYEELIQEDVVVIVDQAPEVKEPILTDSELIAMVVHAEAGNQPMIGRVAVASVVLNRCDYWGLTVESVVYAKNQFVIANSYTESDMRAVEIAMNNRDLFPDNLLYFRAGDYHLFGEPWEHIGDHYFTLAKEN